jgi:hypothetical protein
MHKHFTKTVYGVVEATHILNISIKFGQEVTFALWLLDRMLIKAPKHVPEEEDINVSLLGIESMASSYRLSEPSF